ncbi:MAG: hypothetical protein KF862_08700 [Chitinophagaceae bacterium]|nr:hypothetical protein [Chitinophagaceae bacterium]
MQAAAHAGASGQAATITTSGVGSVDPGRRFAIEARGFNEGFRSALTLGMSEWFSGDPLNDYSTTQEKLWYLEARLKGDAAAVLFGLGEAEVGTGGLATTGITGVGAVVSGVAIAHGLSVAAKGTADIALTWQKIYKLNMAGSSGSSAQPPVNNNQSSGGSIGRGVGGQKAKDVVDYAAKNKGAARPGYKGGSAFSNDGRGGGQILPKTDAKGNSITYKEYDVSPYQKGTNRGTERVVISSEGKAYYTNDHYKTFTQIQ